MWFVSSAAGFSITENSVTEYNNWNRKSKNHHSETQYHPYTALSQTSNKFIKSSVLEYSFEEVCEILLIIYTVYFFYNHHISCNIYILTVVNVDVLKKLMSIVLIKEGFCFIFRKIIYRSQTYLKFKIMIEHLIGDKVKLQSKIN